MSWAGRKLLSVPDVIKSCWATLGFLLLRSKSIRWTAVAAWLHILANVGLPPACQPAPWLEPAAGHGELTELMLHARGKAQRGLFLHTETSPTLNATFYSCAAFSSLLGGLGVLTENLEKCENQISERRAGMRLRTRVCRGVGKKASS